MHNIAEIELAVTWDFPKTLSPLHFRGASECLHSIYMTNQRPGAGREVIEKMVPAPSVKLGT